MGVKERRNALTDRRATGNRAGMYELSSDSPIRLRQFLAGVWMGVLDLVVEAFY